MIKRIICLLMALLVFLPLCACGKDEKSKQTVSKTELPESQMVVALNPEIKYSDGTAYNAFENISADLEKDINGEGISLYDETGWNWMYYSEESSEWVRRKAEKIDAWQNITLSNKSQTPYSYSFNDNSLTALTPYITSAVRLTPYEIGTVPSKGILLSVAGDSEEGLCFVAPKSGKLTLSDPGAGSISIIQRVQDMDTASLSNDEADRTAQVIIYCNGKPLWAAEFGNPRHYGKVDEDGGVYSALFPKLEDIEVKEGDLISIVVNNLTDTRTPLSMVPDESKKFAEASKIEKIDGRNYISANGKPYLLYGMQIRLDRAVKRFDVTSDEQFDKYIKPYFENCAKLGFKTVAIPIRWRQIEPIKDNYNFTILKKYYDYAKEFDLQVQLLWFGLNVCGWSVEAPAYILNEKETYSYLENYPDVLDMTDMDTIERAMLAFGELLDFLYEYDTDRRTVAIQLENEPDSTASDGPEIDNHTDGDLIDSRFWLGGQKNAMYDLINALGMMVKTGPYRCVTRVNLRLYQCYYNGVRENIIGEVCDLDGVDIVGFDYYDPKIREGIIDRMKLEGNVPHYPELLTGNQFGVTLALDAFTHGGGAIYYQLKPVDDDDDSCVFTDKDNTWNFPKGELIPAETSDNPDMELYTPETEELTALNKMLACAGCKIAINDPQKTALFNELRERVCNQTLKVGDIDVTFRTRGAANYGGCGYVTEIEDGEYLVFATKGQSSFTFSGKTVVSAEAGGYDGDGNWKKSKDIPVSGNAVEISSDTVSEALVLLVKTK